MVTSLSFKDAFKFGPKHYLNVRSSINYAFNSSRMQPPPKVRTLSKDEALKDLSITGKQFEILYCL